MVWINSISELQYYNPILGFPCYCDLLVEPSDLWMQHTLSAPTTGLSTLIEIYSADGLLNYGGYSGYFTITYGTNQNNQTYFSIKLNTFAPPMCEHLCWILKVTVTLGGNVIFQKYTHRFCNANCCSGITSATIEGDDGTITQYTITPAPITTDCGTPIIRLETWNDCYDAFTGEYYGTGYRKVTNIRGRYLRLPRTIEKTVSMNCKVQKVQSARLFQIESWDYYPEWKMDEIELQLQAQHINIDGAEMVYLGGQPFSKPNICQQIFLLNADFQECNKWQIFGCGPCDTVSVNAYFRLADPDSGVYDEDRRYIGNTPEEIADYFRSLSGVTDVQIIEPDIDCGYEAVILVTGLQYLPSFIYEGGTQSRYKIYSANNVDDICTNVGPVCTKPTIGTIELNELTCTVPEIGEIELTRQVLVPYNFDVTITEDGNQFSDSRMDGYEVIAIITNAQSYNSEFFTKVLNSDTLVSKLDINGDPFLYFNTGQVVTVLIQ